jgi:hypothetical protein
MPTEARIPDFVLPSFADPHSGRIVLLADNLTGACDAGAAFLRSGRSVRVWFGTDAFNFRPRIPSRRLTPSSRALSAAPCSPRSLSRLHRSWRRVPIRFFSRAVDSAATRAAVAAELLAAQSALGARAMSSSLLLFPPPAAPYATELLEIEDAAGQHYADSTSNACFPLLVQRPHLPRLATLASLRPLLTPARLCSSATARPKTDLDALARAANGSARPALRGLRRPWHRRSPAWLPARPMTALVPPMQSAPCSSRERLIPSPNSNFDELDSRRSRTASAYSASIPGFRRRSAHSLGIPFLCSAGPDPHRRRNSAACGSRPRCPLSFILLGELAPGIPWGTSCRAAMRTDAPWSPSLAALVRRTAFNEILAALRGRA